MAGLLSAFFDYRVRQRRSGTDRRAGKAPPRGVERRAQDRRSSGDRRTWEAGLIYRTSDSASKIEDWLAANCDGEWGIVLDDIHESLEKKSFRIMFTDIEDKYYFMANYGRRRKG